MGVCIHKNEMDHHLTPRYMPDVCRYHVLVCIMCVCMYVRMYVCTLVCMYVHACVEPHVHASGTQDFLLPPFDRSRSSAS